MKKSCNRCRALVSTGGCGSPEKQGCGLGFDVKPIDGEISRLVKCAAIIVIAPNEKCTPAKNWHDFNRMGVSPFNVKKWYSLDPYWDKYLK